MPVRWFVFKTAPKRKPELAYDSDVVLATQTGTPSLPMKLLPEAQAKGWMGLTLTKQILTGISTAFSLRSDSLW